MKFDRVNRKTADESASAIVKGNRARVDITKFF